MYKSLGSPVSRCFHHLPSSSSPFQPIPAHLLGVFAPEVGIDVVPEQRCGILVRLRALKVPKAHELHLAKNPWHPVRLGVLNGFTMVYHMTLVDTICHMATWFTMVYYDIDWVDLAHKICWIFRIHLCSEEQDT